MVQLTGDNKSKDSTITVTLHLPSECKSFSNPPVPATKAGTDEVSYPTALQQCAHLYPTIVDGHKLGHLQ